MADSPDIPKRRPRYRGTHPRRFEEKYKELNPDKYTDEIAKVAARGHTPAGSHRPICVDEIIAILTPAPGQTGLDVTLGYGGHTRHLLNAIAPDGKLFAIDTDPTELAKTEARLRGEGWTNSILTVRHLNFAGAAHLLQDVPEGFDFILADLGISSMQLDNPERGFSAKFDAPLDLRLNQQRGITAAVMLAGMSVDEIETMLRRNSDEPHATVLARGIHRHRNEIATTGALTAIIQDIITTTAPNTDEFHISKSVRRVFQALRIQVNNEFFVLQQLLDTLPLMLKKGGKVAILSFHSGEDNRVNAAFREGCESGIYADYSKFAIRPNSQEKYDNPRSKSALLRWAQRS